MTIHKLAVYGTLRNGCGNWAYFLRGTSILVEGGDTLTGYTMHTWGGVPVIRHTGVTTDIIKVDVFDDVQLEDQIDRLELGAGYSIGYDVTEAGHEVKLYTYQYQRGGRDEHIVSGDWKKYLEERYPERALFGEEQ